MTDPLKYLFVLRCGSAVAFKFLQKGRDFFIFYLSAEPWGAKMASLFAALKIITIKKKAANVLDIVGVQVHALQLSMKSSGGNELVCT